MQEIDFLQRSFEKFNKATGSLKEAYSNLEKRFEGINRELEIKNRELEQTIIEKEDVKNYLHNILESLTNGVIVTDLEGRVQRINRSAQTFVNMKENEIYGRHLRLILNAIPEKKWDDIFSLKSLQDELRNKIRMNGYTLEAFCSPVTARNGEQIGMVIILRDVTRTEKLEEMAIRTEKFAAMGEMAANIAHEIRNPLGSIELFASLLLKDLHEKKDRDRVSKIVISVKNMDNKISNLLMFTKTATPSMKHINIQEILRDTISFTEQIAIQGNITFLFIPAKTDPIVIGDEEMLKQVFLNIILNAFQAMPEGGCLRIEAIIRSERGMHGEGDAVEVVFADNGIGIPEENMSRIFDPFFSTHEETSGLGLAIVHNIINIHKGTIHVEGNPTGGTIFTIMLPLADKAD